MEFAEYFPVWDKLTKQQQEQVKLTPPGLRVNECIAWCCSDCKKVVADYAEIPQKWSLF